MPLLLEGHAAEVFRRAYRQYQERFNLLRLSLRQLQDQCWWEGEHAGLVANKILRRRDCPLNRQHWLFGERSMNQGTGSVRRNVYLSRITLYTAQLSPLQLLHPVERGEYVMHQWLWQLFPCGQQRQFSLSARSVAGAFRFFVLSPQLPAESEILRSKAVRLIPNCGLARDCVLACGQIQRFVKPASATIC